MIVMITVSGGSDVVSSGAFSSSIISNFLSYFSAYACVLWNLRSHRL
ncbi:MAG: hypothetical protein HDT22_00760 [Ruminococcus sp.]|nr:hypothetical protein [Ruminococcus sp.]